MAGKGGCVIAGSDFLIRAETDLAPFLRRMDPAKRDPSVPPKKVWSGKMPNLLYVPNKFPEICLILHPLSRLHLLDQLTRFLTDLDYGADL